MYIVLTVRCPIVPSDFLDHKLRGAVDREEQPPEILATIPSISQLSAREQQREMTRKGHPVGMSRLTSFSSTTAMLRMAPHNTKAKPITALTRSGITEKFTHMFSHNPTSLRRL
jgi:hypothetical protein